MHMNHFYGFLAFMSPQQPGQGQPQSPVMMFLPMILIVIAFYFLLIRPQQKRAKQLSQLIQSLKPGDKVVASSGIIGVVVSVKDKTVSLRSADTKLEVTKASITEILERDSTPAS